MRKYYKYFIILCLFISICFGAVARNSAFSLQEKQEEVEPIVVLGGGVGSLSSALYLGRAGLAPLVIEGPNPGGLLTQSHSVQNWPGVFEMQGLELTEKMREQAFLNGARFLREEVVSVDFKNRPFTIVTKSLLEDEKRRIIKASSCIIAMGTQPNFLNVPGEQKYWGKGVTNCAICDGSLYKGKVVGVVGGGDAAILEALYLSNIAKKVYVFVRKGSFKGMEEKRLTLLKKRSNVQIFYKTKVEEVLGDGQTLLGVLVQGQKKLREVSLDGLFLAIGSKPNTLLFEGQLPLDAQGYIKLSHDQETSIEGVYAIGDIVDPVYKQAVSAAGDGAKAALQAQQYLSKKFEVLVHREDISDSAPLEGEVLEITSASQLKREIASGEGFIVVDFYAPWCNPCKKISPIFASYARRLGEKVKFLKVNVDEVKELSAEYEIRSMPTVLLLDSQGKVLERKVGFEPIKELLHQLREKAEKRRDETPL